MSVITITGERQTGKTEMVIDRMVRHAREGMKVAYIGQTLVYAQHVQARIENRDEAGVVKSYRANGAQRITFSSGGSIRFLSAGKDSLRGFDLDALVWDDVQKPISDDARIASKLIYHIISE
ncbi:hypothetical protein [Mycobacterium phage WXIN]|nr:hypothetical protein [Mycobacterium phage WXIN]